MNNSEKLLEKVKISEKISKIFDSIKECHLCPVSNTCNYISDICNSDTSLCRLFKEQDNLDIEV